VFSGEIISQGTVAEVVSAPVSVPKREHFNVMTVIGMGPMNSSWMDCLQDVAEDFGSYGSKELAFFLIPCSNVNFRQI
jgi:hypothetical protein